MAQKQNQATLRKRGNEVTITLARGVDVTVDLSQHKLDKEQARILQKAVRALSNADVETLLRRGCPSRGFLEPAEFERIRGLKARITTSGGGSPVAGPIVDFCLHVINV